MQYRENRVHSVNGSKGCGAGRTGCTGNTGCIGNTVCTGSTECTGSKGLPGVHDVLCMNPRVHTQVTKGKGNNTECTQNTGYILHWALRK